VNLRNLEYLIQEAFIGIWRNGIMAVASLSTVALSLAVLGGFLLLMLGSHGFVERQLARFEIAVYMPDGATQQDAERVREAILRLPLTEKAELQSRELEWQKLKRSLSTRIPEGVIGNPLPYTIFVRARDARQTESLAGQIRRIPRVESADAARESFGHVKALADLVKLIGIVASVGLCLTTIFIISNAIRLTLFARRHEIRIMQLVGATNWFIRVPLVIEGLLLGTAGAALAVGLIATGGQYMVALVQRGLPVLRDLSSGVAPGQLLVALIGGGAIIGALGSLVSIRRFLKA